jgi:hypothetical protein
VFTAALERDLLKASPCNGVKVKRRADERSTREKWTWLMRPVQDNGASATHQRCVPNLRNDSEAFDRLERNDMKKPAKNERAVIVTTEHRGVFFGYASDTNGDQIALRASRLCLHWSSDVKGFMGLAGTGPTKSCRIGPPADITLRKITAVLEVTDVATKAWEAAPWNG